MTNPETVAPLPEAIYDAVIEQFGVAARGKGEKQADDAMLALLELVAYTVLKAVARQDAATEQALAQALGARVGGALTNSHPLIRPTTPGLILN